MFEHAFGKEAPKLLLLSFLLFYFAAGMFTTTIPGGEWYPFFSWFLFTKVPPTIQTDYNIRIIAVEGEILERQLFLEQAPHILSPRSHSNTEYLGIIRMLGESFKRRDEEAISRWRERLEKNFTRHPVTYKLVEITFNPIERWKSGAILDITPLAAFESLP